MGRKHNILMIEIKNIIVNFVGGNCVNVSTSEESEIKWKQKM